MTGRNVRQLWGFLLIMLLVACQGSEEPPAAYDPADLQFSGELALDISQEFVRKFPNRASEEINNELAAEYLHAALTETGWQCIIDEWDVINYSQPLPLQNIVCQLPGESSEEIVVMAHYDQSPGSGEGADNNASGVAILLQLAEIMAAGRPWPYTLVFAATDGQVYGLLGAQRLVETHPDPERIIAAISLDNLGLDAYDGLGMATVGHEQGYGPIWLQQTAQKAARTAGDLWVPQMQSEWVQTMAQTMPVAVSDQGPFVAAGVPAIGLYGSVPDGYLAEFRELFQTPADSIERQSADSLNQGGRVSEALIRQLLGMQEFPDSFFPYLAYDDGEKLVLPGFFYLIALILAGIFFLASYLSGSRQEGGYIHAVITSLPHFLSIWIPFIASILLLYFFVAIGLLNEFDTWPATPKDPLLAEPQWFVIIIWLISLGEFLQLGRRLGAMYMEGRSRPTFSQIRALTFLIITLSILVALLVNPIYVFVFVPLIAWLFISGRPGAGRFLDILLLLMGGLFVYLLIHFLGFILLSINLLVLWYLLLGLSVGTIDFWSASLAFAIFAAGLALVTRPPWGRRSSTAENMAGVGSEGEATQAALDVVDEEVGA